MDLFSSVIPNGAMKELSPLFLKIKTLFNDKYTVFTIGKTLSMGGGGELPCQFLLYSLGNSASPWSFLVWIIVTIRV